MPASNILPARRATGRTKLAGDPEPDASEHDNVAGMLEEAIGKTIRESKLDDADRDQLKQEFELFREELGDFQFALSRPYFTLKEQQSPGEGGLLSITVNPYTCKGCMECVQVCDDDALRTGHSDRGIDRGAAAKLGSYGKTCPRRREKYIRVDDIEEGIGALETILLDKRNYSSLASGDGACLGCGEKSVVHLFTATVEALMQPRVERHLAKLTDLIERLAATHSTDTGPRNRCQRSGNDLPHHGRDRQSRRHAGGNRRTASNGSAAASRSIGNGFAT